MLWKLKNGLLSMNPSLIYECRETNVPDFDGAVDVSYFLNFLMDPKCKEYTPHW